MLSFTRVVLIMVSLYNNETVAKRRLGNAKYPHQKREDSLKRGEKKKKDGWDFGFKQTLWLLFSS